MGFERVIFAGHLEKGEDIFFVAHRHIFVLFKASYKCFFLGIVLPLIGSYYLPALIYGFAIWFFVGFVGMLYHFIDWYFDAWLITNQGVIDIERHGLFHRNSTRIEYQMIDGTSYEIKGVWHTIFNFGDVSVDTMGSKTTLCLKEGNNPKRIERKVLYYMEKFVSEKSLSDQETLKDLLAEIISNQIRRGKVSKRKK